MVPFPETTLPSEYQPTPRYEKGLCFKANKSKDELLDLFPRVTLHFIGGFDHPLLNFVVYIVFGKDGDSNVFCLGILRSDSKDDVSFLGNVQMANLNIGFDLENNMVSFTNTDCATSCAAFSKEGLLVEVEVERTVRERLAFLRHSPHTAGMSHSAAVVLAAAKGLAEVARPGEVIVVELANLVLVELQQEDDRCSYS
ncbi:hypothetical protein PIB30_057942 [Stylosanthes scabra]|uniref:Xylanase inhibitor C-terminal domain-containing protein n=1 Tax=Stylosanthes scabra TaxID=79078 RepID=A0ABU6WN43_9FABA|nr:hypothetical protein [Stylosanthes scabra]